MALKHIDTCISFAFSIISITLYAVLINEIEYVWNDIHKVCVTTQKHILKTFNGYYYESLDNVRSLGYVDGHVIVYSVLWSGEGRVA